MGSQERRTALKAAAAYFGYSTNESSLPKTVDVSVTTVRNGSVKETEFLHALTERIDEAWPENVGNISRTARLGHLDFAHYANRLREELGHEPIQAGDEEGMEKLAGYMRHLVGDGVCLVEIGEGHDRKLLLVNTNISS